MGRAACRSAHGRATDDRRPLGAPTDPVVPYQLTCDRP